MNIPELSSPLINQTLNNDESVTNNNNIDVTTNTNDDDDDDDSYSTDNEESKDKIDPITVLQDGIGTCLLDAAAITVVMNGVLCHVITRYFCTHTHIYLRIHFVFTI